MAAFGGIFCVLWGGFEYWKHHVLSGVVDTLRQTVSMRELPTDWSKSVSPEIREAVSLAHARMAFLKSGTLTPYVDASGGHKLYAPTQDEIKQREETLVTTAKLELSMRDGYMGALVWWLWAILAVLFGIGFSRDERSMPANSTVEPDARKKSARGSP